MRHLLVALVLGVLLITGYFVWHYVRMRDLHRDSYECQMLGGNVSDCMKSRGWGDREATDVFIEDMNRRYRR